MHASGLRRLIFISAMGIYGEVPGELSRSVPDPHHDSAAVTEASDLEQAILRQGWFTRDDEVSYQITEEARRFYRPPAGSRRARLGLRYVIELAGLRCPSPGPIWRQQAHPLARGPAPWRSPGSPRDHEATIHVVALRFRIDPHAALQSPFFVDWCPDDPAGVWAFEATAPRHTCLGSRRIQVVAALCPANAAVPLRYGHCSENRGTIMTSKPSLGVAFLLPILASLALASCSAGSGNTPGTTGSGGRGAGGTSTGGANASGQAGGASNDPNSESPDATQGDASVTISPAGSAACAAIGGLCMTGLDCANDDNMACDPGAGRCCLDQAICPGGGPKVIAGSDYDQSCMTDSDCLEISGGDACYVCTISCRTDPVAINRSSYPRYMADISRTLAAAQMGVGCGCPANTRPRAGPSCRGGKCTADLSPLDAATE